MDKFGSELSKSFKNLRIENIYGMNVCQSRITDSFHRFWHFSIFVRKYILIVISKSGFRTSFIWSCALRFCWRISSDKRAQPSLGNIVINQKSEPRRGCTARPGCSHRKFRVNFYNSLSKPKPSSSARSTINYLSSIFLWSF